MNSCIRVFADINQIKACKENIRFVDESAEYLANYETNSGIVSPRGQRQDIKRRKK